MNKPTAWKAPSFCSVCGHRMIPKRVISCYDLQTGEAVYKSVFECADAGSAHGTTELLYENQPGEKQQLTSIFQSFIQKILQR